MLLPIWIRFCMSLVALGWVLSFWGELTLAAYEIALGVFIFGELFHLKRMSKPFLRSLRRTLRRLTSQRLLLPGFFGLSVLLLFFKGAVMPPFHDDGLCYRIPRALHWIMAHRWHWISAEDVRLDVCGTVSEWLTVPILLIFKTDRLVFLPNWISHLFLPGLIFSVWRNLGVSPRIAWLAMWLLPTGFCFALQAVNTSNDSLAAFFALAAFFFALKGRKSALWSDFALSILCMFLATGVKLNMLSLGLAWMIALSYGWRPLLSRPALTAGTLFLGLLVSFAPTALFNWWHSRGWTGLAFDQLPPAWVNYVCTTFQIIAQNLMPPLFGGNRVAPMVIPGIKGSLMGLLFDYYSLEPVYYSNIAVEQAGLGFMVVMVLLLMFLATRAQKRIQPASREERRLNFMRKLIFAALGVAFLHYLFFVNSDQPARLICAYYLLLVPAFFSWRELRSKILWQVNKIMVGTAMVLGLGLEFFLTENPPINFFPAFEERLRWDNEYEQLSHRFIPDEEKTVGIIRFYDQRETWLWKPYGSRLVVELPVRPDIVELRKRGIRYVAVSREILVRNKFNIKTWLNEQPWVLVGSIVLGDDNTWYFVRLND